MEQASAADQPKNAAKGIIFGTLVISIGYAILRYHIMGPVPWKDFPFFIINKGFSLAAFILISINFSLGPLNNITKNVRRSWLDARKAVGMTGFLLVLIHALMSFMLFKKEVYGQFFQENGTLTMIAGLSMLAGVLGFVVLWAYNLSFQTHLKEDKVFIGFLTSRTFLIWALTLGLVHLFFMGYQGWMNPSGWHGGLPPISLLGFSFGIICYIINFIGRK